MMSSPSLQSGFAIHIFQSEIDEIRKHVAQNRWKESVGDVFGLWTNSGNAVVHIILSPEYNNSPTARGCLNDSRLQPEDDVKIYLEKKYMLCHIGKWHFSPYGTSTQPSTNQMSAVKSFCACGEGHESCILLSFCTRNENVQPYLFTDKGQNYINAGLLILPGVQSSVGVTGNPVRNAPPIGKILERYSSTAKTSEQMVGINHGVPPSTSHGHSNNSPSNWETFENQHKNAKYARSPTTESRQSSPSSANPLPVGQNSSSFQSAGLLPSQSPSSPTNQSVARQGTPRAYLSPAHQHPLQSSPDTPTKFLPSISGERILQKVYEKISSMVDIKKPVILPCDRYKGVIPLKFEINQTECEVQFPNAFPEVPAKISCNLPEQLYTIEVKPKNSDKKLDSLDGIITAIKFCFVLSGQTPTNASTVTDCRDHLGHKERSNKTDGIKGEAWKFSERVRDIVKATFKISDDVDFNVKTEKSGREKVEIKFKHYCEKKWLIAIPGNFPDAPVRIYLVDTSRRKEANEEIKPKFEICDLQGIIRVIKERCPCPLCFRTR